MKYFTWYVLAPPARYNHSVSSFGFTSGAKAPASKWLPSPLPQEDLTSFPLPIRSTQPQHPAPTGALGTEGEGSQHRDMASLPGPCRKSLHCPYYGVPPFAHMRRDTYPSRRAHQDRLKKSNTTRATLERGGTACLLADFCIQLPLSAIVEITTAEIFHDWGPW